MRFFKQLAITFRKNNLLEGFALGLFFLCLSGCNSHRSPVHGLCCSKSFEQSEYFIIFLVDAPHLDYSSNRNLLKTLAKHPSNGSKNGDVGHAWIYLQGIIDGESVFIEGGHSGETGRQQPKYFDGIMNYIEFGYANPTANEKQHCRYEPNPIKYLWSTQKDGFFQSGSGHHIPTFAAKVNLTKQQFFEILEFIQPDNYDYTNYALTGNQCSSFVEQIANMIHLPIQSEMSIQIDPVLNLNHERLRFWEDPRYAVFTFSSPDLIERNLQGWVKTNRAEYALGWYMEHRKQPFRCRMNALYESVVRFPTRLQRVIQFNLETAVQGDKLTQSS